MAERLGASDYEVVSEILSMSVLVGILVSAVRLADPWGGKGIGKFSQPMIKPESEPGSVC